MRALILMILLVILTISISNTKSIEKPKVLASPTIFEGAIEEVDTIDIEKEEQILLAKKRLPRDVTETLANTPDLVETVDWFTKNKWIVIGIGAVILIMIVCCIWDTICCCC